ncbi:MAG: amidohydrolase family protein [Thermoproteota archaeon]|nr:amidohydrolase family protein [Thermoproteota archaeon]
MSKIIYFIISISLLVLFPFQQSLSSISNPGTVDSSNEGESTLVLYGATLIDGTDAIPKRNSVVIINGDRITSIVEKNQYHLSTNTNVHLLNLTGYYIIPGLFDMHAHVANIRVSSYNHSESIEMLHKLLGWGVTTIRNPGGPTEQAVMLRNMVNAGQLIGPQIFTAGNLINSLPPTGFVETIVQNETEVRKEVQHQSNMGVDYVKLYVNLAPSLVHAGIEEAHAQGIKAMGHLFATSWSDAAMLGIDALTHGIPENPSLLTIDKRQEFLSQNGGPYTHSLWLELADLKGNEIKQMIKGLVENNVDVDPTLVIFEAILSEDIRTDRNAKLWSKVLNLTKMMYEAGVPITSGSDIPNFLLEPGVSLHRELELLAQAGIPPLEVIKIATKNSANSLGILDNVGTIEAGKQADLVVLSKNPSINISNTQSVVMVIRGGQLINGSLSN